MMQRIILFFTSLFIFGYACSQEIQMMENVRGTRYCEIFIAKGGITKITVTIYNTLGCSNCPQTEWQKLEADKIKKEFRALSVTMNGPRYFLMDKIGQKNGDPPTVSFGKLKMKARATLPVPLRTILKGKSKPYSEQVVHRSTMTVFNKGRDVYELVSPTNTYVMQSYSLVIDPNLKEADLITLSNRLTLPPGWHYKVVKLKNDLVLQTSPDKDIYVIQDDLNNNYQRID